ncbi:MAG: hypothetical protein ACXWPI_14510 [Ktedonobacterales bacterium]
MQQELDAAIIAADRGDWELLEQFTQEKHALDPYRINTCVYIRANHEANQRIEYHRGLGREGWWRKVMPLFADETNSKERRA